MAAIAVVAALFVLRVPAGALVGSVVGESDVERLERLLSAERQRNDESNTALTEREKEITTRGMEIDRLRADRDQSERLRGDLETSYRKLLADVNDHLQTNKSEKSQLRKQVASAEAELQKLREDQERRASEQEQLLRIHRELSPVLDARVESRGVVLTIPGVFFGTGYSTIGWESHGILKRIAEQLVVHPQIKVTIEGHTDSNGSSDENLELSQQRAAGIRDILAEAGVDRSRMTTLGRGEHNPLYSEETRDGRLGNRRVELVLSH